MYRKDQIMKSPKLLFWLANKAGISLPRAEVLWRAAERHATHVTGMTETTATSAYWSTAMDRLHELVAAESLREDVASFGWRRWTRLYSHIWQAPLEVLDVLVLNNMRGWRTLKPLQLG